MNISARCQYACRAMADLASHEDRDQPVTVVSIAERRGIPEKYLVHILLQLKRAGLVRSLRGAQGGYLLARPPESISLAEVVTAVDGPILDPLPVDDEENTGVESAWRTVAARVAEMLSEVTVNDLGDDGSGVPMYHI